MHPFVKFTKEMPNLSLGGQEFTGISRHLRGASESALLRKNLRTTNMRQNLTLMSAVGVCICNLLKKNLDVSLGYELCEAAFAFQIDWRLIDIQKAPIEGYPERPLDEALFSLMRARMHLAMFGEDEFRSEAPAHDELLDMYNALRFVLISNEVAGFDTWIRGLLDRIVDADVRVYTPEIFLQDRSEQPTHARSHKFAFGKNRYFRSEEERVALGFSYQS